MSITRLQSDKYWYYYLNNDTFEYEHINSSCNEHYDFQSNHRDVMFYIGDAQLLYRDSIKNMKVTTYLDIIFSSGEKLSFSLGSSKITEEYLLNNKILYFKPVDNVIKSPKIGYKTIIFSEYPIRRTISSMDGEGIFDATFGILVFNKSKRLIGVALNCGFGYPVKLNYCKDTKFSTLVCFNNINDICKNIVK